MCVHRLYELASMKYLEKIRVKMDQTLEMILVTDSYECET